MRTINRNYERLLEDFKARLKEALLDAGLKQEALADLLGVNQSTIHRYLSTDADMHFPAAATAMLSDEQFRPIAEAILQFQCERLGYRLTPEKVQGLNGQVQDELNGLVDELGQIARGINKSDPPHKISKNCDDLIRIAHRLKQELAEATGARVLPIKGEVKG